MVQLCKLLFYVYEKKNPNLNFRERTNQIHVIFFKLKSIF